MEKKEFDIDKLAKLVCKIELPYSYLLEKSLANLRTYASAYKANSSNPEALEILDRERMREWTFAKGILAGLAISALIDKKAYRKSIAELYEIAFPEEAGAE